MGLSGEEKASLKDAIVDGFSLDEFERLSMYRLEKDFLKETPPADFPHRVFKFIELAERQGWTGKLVKAIHEENPNHTTIVKFAASYLRSAASRSVVIDASKASRFEDYWSWLRNLTAVKRSLVGLDIPPVFVELTLDHHLDHLNHSAELSDRGRSGLEQLLELSGQHQPRLTGRWILRGAPGSGKTKLLLRFAAKLARAQDLRQIPLFFSLPQLMERSNFLEHVEHEVCRTQPRARGLADELYFAGQEGHLVVLLDGFDEVGENSQDETRTFLQTLSESWPRSAIFVSSRPVEGLRLPRFRTVDLLPLDRRRKIELLAHLLDDSNAAKAERELDRLEGDLGLRQLTGNPLNLTLLAALVRAGEKPDRDRLAFYGQSIDRLLVGKDRPHGQQLPRRRSIDWP